MVLPNELAACSPGEVGQSISWICSRCKRCCSAERSNLKRSTTLRRLQFPPLRGSELRRNSKRPKVATSRQGVGPIIMDSWRAQGYTHYIIEHTTMQLFLQKL